MKSFKRSWSKGLQAAVVVVSPELDKGVDDVSVEGETEDGVEAIVDVDWLAHDWQDLAQ